MTLKAPLKLLYPSSRIAADAFIYNPEDLDALNLPRLKFIDLYCVELVKSDEDA